MAASKPSKPFIPSFLLCLLCLVAHAKGATNLYSVTIGPFLSSEGSVTGAGEYTNGATATLTFVPVSDCVQFEGWFIGREAVGASPTLTFTVASNVNLTVEILSQANDIQTFSYPADAGVVTGGGYYSTCETNATVTATPKPGFKFIGWTLGQPGNALIATNWTYSFAPTNEILYANFASLHAPVATITFPVRGERVNRRILPVTGRTSNRSAVAAVYCGLAPRPGGDFIWTAATTSDNWQNWSANLILYPGTNVVAAYAIDNTGVVSITNTVVFLSRAAGLPPESLAGLAADVSPNPGAPFGYSFGASAFASQSSDTNVAATVGDYTYTITGSNTAQINLTYVAPPNMAGLTDVVEVIFTSPSTATVSNITFGTGAMTLRPISNSGPSTLEMTTITDNAGDVVKYFNGLFAYQPDSFFGSSEAGFYRYTQFSPVSGLIEQISTNDPGSEDWVIATFQNPHAGTFLATSYAPGRTAPYLGAGTFTAKPLALPRELAPAYLTGMKGSFQPENQTAYTFSFGPATLAAASANPNGVVGAANYVYTRTGRNTGELTFTYVAPETSANVLGALDLFFTASRGGIYFNTNGYEAGTFQLVAAPQTAPTSLTGKTLHLTSGIYTEIVALGQGTVTNTYPGEGPPISGSFTVFPASPQVDVVTLSFPGNLEVDYVELTFATATSGSVIYTATAPNYHTATLGRFTMK